MGWQQRVPRKNTKPERQMRKILKALKNEGLIRKFVSNRWIQVPFRMEGYRLEADFLVDDILVVEVHGKRWHTRKKRAKKDIAKRASLESCGYPVLWVWDDELRYAFQVRRGPAYTKFIRDMVITMLNHAKKLEEAYKSFEERKKIFEKLKVEHPELGKVFIRRRRE